MPKPQLEELDAPPPEDASGEVAPAEEPSSTQGEDASTQAPEAGAPQEAASAEGTRQESEEPKYNVTIKGAERLDNPPLPDVPDE
jgi:hypothetical protein